MVAVSERIFTKKSSQRVTEAVVVSALSMGTWTGGKQISQYGAPSRSPGRSSYVVGNPSSRPNLTHRPRVSPIFPFDGIAQHHLGEEHPQSQIRIGQFEVGDGFLHQGTNVLP